MGLVQTGLRFLRAGKCRQPLRRKSHESRRQHAVARYHLRRSNPWIAAAIRLGAEYRTDRRSLVGICPSAACRLGDRVRPLWHRLRSDLDRSRQCPPLHLVRRHLDRRATVRSPRGEAGHAVRRRRVMAGRRPHPRLRQFVRSARATLVRHHHCLYLGDGIRVLARSLRAVGLSLACDLHAVRARCALSAAHAARRHAAVPARRQSGARERVALRAQFRGAAVHHLHRLHLPRHGQGAHRASPQDRGPGRSVDRHLQPPRLPARRRRISLAARRRIRGRPR
jgi:hypothetical protein